MAFLPADRTKPRPVGQRFTTCNLQTPTTQVQFADDNAVDRSWDELLREGFEEGRGARLGGIEPKRFQRLAPGLRKPAKFGVDRGQIEVGAGAPWVEAARALEIGTSGGRIAIQEERQAQLFVRLGPIRRPLNRDLQPSDRFGQGVLLECHRPQIERSVNRRSRDRVLNSRQLLDRLALGDRP